MGVYKENSYGVQSQLNWKNTEEKLVKQLRIQLLFILMHFFHEKQSIIKLVSCWKCPPSLYLIGKIDVLPNVTKRSLKGPIMDVINCT